MNRFEEKTVVVTGGNRGIGLAIATRFAAEASANPDLIRVWLDWSTGVRQDVWPRYLELLDQKKLEFLYCYMQILH